VTNPYEQYLENSVLTASPVELVTMLYRIAIEATGDAKVCLQSGDIEGRTKAINRAFEALMELITSLDLTNGGDVADNLLRLYSYMQQRVLQAQCEQDAAPLDEVAKLLTTLNEAWAQLRDGAAEPSYAAYAAV
jgi:flagellar protein FliS